MPSYLGSDTEVEEMELVPNGLLSKEPHIQDSSHICLSHEDTFGDNGL